MYCAVSRFGSFRGTLLLFPYHFHFPFTLATLYHPYWLPRVERVGRFGGGVVFLLVMYFCKTHSVFWFRLLHFEPCPGWPAGSCCLGKRREILLGNVVCLALLLFFQICCYVVTTFSLRRLLRRTREYLWGLFSRDCGEPHFQSQVCIYFECSYFMWFLFVTCYQAHDHFSVQVDKLRHCYNCYVGFDVHCMLVRLLGSELFVLGVLVGSRNCFSVT